LNDTFAAQLTLQNLFQFPTIAELASLISQARLDDTEAAVLSQLVEEIAGLSEEQVRAALALEPTAPDTPGMR
jgi:hypothetical protein